MKRALLPVHCLTAILGILVLAGCSGVGPTNPTSDDPTSTPTLSNEASLSSLSLSVGVLSPKFSSANLAYSANVPNGTTSVTVTATTANSAAKAVVSGASSLSTGDNAVTVKVTAEDGTTTKTYTITVKVAPADASTDATLSSLSISAGTLSPAFDSATLSYTASVANNIDIITVNAVATDSAASVSAGSTALAEGSNTIEVVVTAEDGATTKTYTITVTRALSSDALLSGIALSSGTLDPVFSNTTGDYYVTVANSVSSITVTGTVRHTGATVSGNGSYALEVGTPKVISLDVTAADGTSTKTYTVTVLRAAADASTDATLSSLSVTDSAGNELVASFDPATTSYNATVAYCASNFVTIMTTPTDSAALALGQQSGSSQTFSCDTVTRLLDVGTNTFTITVTAEDGVTTKVYTVVVTLSEAATTLTISSPTAGGNLACGMTTQVTGSWTGTNPAKISIVLGMGSSAIGADAALDTSAKTWSATLDTTALPNSNSMLLVVQASDASDAVLNEKLLTVGLAGSTVDGFALSGSVAFGGTAPTTGTLWVAAMAQDGSSWYAHEVSLAGLTYTITGPLAGTYNIGAIYSSTPGLDFMTAYYQAMAGSAVFANVSGVNVTGDITIPTITLE